ncbi:MAG: ABC transporter substrate-binding protein [Oscillospiraceae bacterium]
MKKALALLMALVLTFALLAGCSDSAAGNTPSESPSQTVSQTPEESPAPSQEPEPGPYTVTDMMGVEVTFESVPETVATFGSIGVLNTLVECLGCGERICNNMGSRFESTKSYPHLRLEFAPQTADAPELTNADGELLTEDIIQLDPDVCLTMTKTTAEQLRALGLNVIYLEWQKQDDVTVAMRLMGEVLGKQELAEDYLTYFDDSVAEAESLVAGIPEAERKTVLYGSITDFSQPHIIAEWWITEAGGISVTNNGRPDTESYNYTMEDVLMWDPDVLLVSGRTQIEELTTNTTFADLTAVQNGDIYCVPTVGHAWGNRTVEQPLTIFWTMNKMYPDIMTDEMLGEKIYYFYDHFFNYQLSDEQLAVYVEGK